MMRRLKLVGRALLIGILIALVTAACQMDIGLSDLDLPFIPTATNTPLPTATNTPTATVPPKPDSSDEVFEVDVQEDDSTVFVDKELGYRLAFSPEWLLVPADEEIRAEIVAQAAEEVQGTLARLFATSMQQAGFRLLVFDYTGRYEINPNYIANFSVIFDETVSPDIELQVILDDAVENMPELFEDSKVVYQSIEQNARGIPYASMIVDHPASTFGMPVKQIIMMTQLESGMIVLTFSIHKEGYLAAERSLKNVINSFDLVE